MAGKNPGALKEGKFSYLSKNDNIVSKKQVNYDAKNEAESIADTYTQVAYWMNMFTFGRALETLDDFTISHLIYHRDGYLRSGYVSRLYSKVYPIDTPSLPGEPYQDIIPKTFPQLKMHDDISGREMIKLSAGLDYEFARGSEAFIDPNQFEEFVNLHSIKTGEALGTQMRVLAHLYAMAAFPATTLSVDPDIVPFFDASLVPDEAKSPGAKKWFDNNSKFWKDYVKKEIFGQVQEKLTNVGYYSPELYAPYRESFFEIKKPAKPTTDDKAETTKKLFFLKETASGTNQNKHTLHKDLNPFACHLALTMAIREKWISMTQTVSPMNMGNYKPYEAAAQTSLQTPARVPPESLEIILNPYDLAAIRRGTSNTSPWGNYTATLADIEAAGTTIYAVSTMLPGHFIIQDKNTFKIIKILYQGYTTNFEWLLAIQRGSHLFLKVFISGFSAFYKGIPLSYVPPMECLYNNYSSFVQ